MRVIQLGKAIGEYQIGQDESYWSVLLRHSQFVIVGGRHTGTAIGTHDKQIQETSKIQNIQDSACAGDSLQDHSEQPQIEMAVGWARGYGVGGVHIVWDQYIEIAKTQEEQGCTRVAYHQQWAGVPERQRQLLGHAEYWQIASQYLAYCPEPDTAEIVVAKQT